jgi:hypothetical protein
MNIEKAQHDILQVPITKTIIDWAREQAHISMNRCVGDSRYPGEILNIEKELEEQFEETILFALRVGILLGRGI